MKTSDFGFVLPEELIAQYPLRNRSASRLLCVSPRGLVHRHFSDLPELLTSNDLLILNNTKVIPARLFAKKETGGKVEILIERIVADNFVYAHLKSNKALSISSTLILDNDIRVTICEKLDGIFLLHFKTKGNIREVMDQLGKIPLPNYIKRNADDIDNERYQTIYCVDEGAIAAPTAGLHFDAAIFARLQEKEIPFDFITLHVGAGTFKPVLVEDIRQHKMHKEIVRVTPEVCERVNEVKSKGGRVVAVGTTAVRALETAMQGQKILKPYMGETNIFIYPGYHFQCIDALITNFHLPRSTLLMLVCALGGYKQVMASYQAAIEHRYRFYSYGDAMFIDPQGG